MANAIPATTPAEDAPTPKGGQAKAEPGRAKTRRPAKPKPGDVWYEKGEGPIVYRVEQGPVDISRTRIDGPNGTLPPGVEVA